MVRRTLVVAAIALVAFACEAPVEVAPDEVAESRAEAPPPAPTNLSATAVSASRIDLAWIYRGSGDTQVHIERSIATGGNFVEIATTGHDAGGFSDTGLDGGTRYWYRVRACSASACSAYSQTALAATPPGTSWTVQQVPHVLMGVSGVSATNVLAVGSGVGLKYDGTSWSNITAADPFWDLPPPFTAAWAGADDAMYGLQLCGPVAKYDGAQWSLIGPPWQQFAEPDEIRPLCWFYWSIWGASTSDIFLVGEFGQAAHFDGSQWTGISPGPFNVFTDELFGVWGTSATDVFVVGGDLWESGRATILHYDGGTWTTMVSSDDTELPILRAVWGSASNNVFAVGQGGTIVRFDGTQWSAMNSGTAANLWGVWGTSADNVYAVGTGGTLLHFDGTSWSSANIGTAANLRSVWVAGSGEVFAVGNGVIVRGTP